MGFHICGLHIYVLDANHANILTLVIHCASKYVANVRLENSRMPTCLMLIHVRFEHNPNVRKRQKH